MAKSVRILCLLVALLLLVLNAQAQSDVRINNIFIHSAESATFTENTDGTYTLTLNTAAEFTPWLTPSVSVGSIATQDMAANWPGGHNGIMELGQLTVYLTLEAVTYNPAAAALTYTATLNDVVSTRAEDNNKEISIPSALGNLTLLIPADVDLTLTLLLGNDLTNTPNLTNVRTTLATPACDALPLLLDNLYTLRGQVAAVHPDWVTDYDALIADYESALSAC